jgi:hypothetical protein
MQIGWLVPLLGAVQVHARLSCRDLYLIKS